MSWKDTLAVIAPTIGTAVGGPFGGMAAKVALDLLDIEQEEGETPEERLEHVMANPTPDMMLKLKSADQAFKLQLKKLDIKETALHLEDVQSARDMQIATRSKMVPILAGLVTAGFFTIAWYVITGRVQGESTLVGTIIGYASAKAEQVLSYYFGKNRTNEVNDEALLQGKR